MKNIKRISAFLGILLFLSIGFEPAAHAMRRHEHYTQRRYNWDVPELIWPALGFLGTITGIYAIGRWAGWWGPESNEQLIERARKHLAHADTYRPLVHVMETVGGGYIQMHSFDESVLYQLALAKRGAQPIVAYITSLQAHIHDLSSSKQALEKRAYTLKREDNWYEVKHIYDRIDHIGKQVECALHELEGLVEYLQSHRSYFQLFEYEDHVRGLYRRQLELLEQYEYDEYALAKALRSCVLSQYSGAFALIEFVKRLNADRAQLEHLAAQPAYNYGNRITCARDIVGRLYRMQESIISDTEYMRLLSEYERVQREKERLRLERDRIRAEERKAAAREREARAMEAKNALKAAELVDKCLEQRYGL